MIRINTNRYFGDLVIIPKLKRKRPTGLLSLPDEILLQILEELIPPGSDVRVDPNCDLFFCLSRKAIWNFSTRLSNRRCARLGQEVLFRTCLVGDLRPERLYLFLRTLLARPALRTKVRDLYLYMPDLKSTTQVPKVFHPMLSQVQLEWGKLTSFANAMREPPQYLAINWICVLLILTPNLRELSLYALDGFPEPFFCALQTLQHAGGFLRGLDFLGLVVPTKVLRSTNISYAIKNVRLDLPKLRSLVLEYLYTEEQSQLAPGRDLNADVAKMFSCKDLQSVSFWGYHSMDFIGQICQAVPTIRSLEVKPPTLSTLPFRMWWASLAPPNHDYIQDLFTAIRPLCGSLERLHILVDSEDHFALWPRFLGEYTALRWLVLEGGFAIAPRLAKSPLHSNVGHIPTTGQPGMEIPVADFFPPNVEEVTIAPFRMDDLAEGDGYPNLLAFFTFLTNNKLRPRSLKKMIIGGPLGVIVEPCLLVEKRRRAPNEARVDFGMPDHHLWYPPPSVQAGITSELLETVGLYKA